MTKIKIATLLILYLSFVSYILIKNIIIPQNFLILGLDPRNDILEKTETTDTIIYANLSPKFDTVSLFSVPRDLWHYKNNTKINQIYPNSYEFIQNSFQEILGQKIDKTIIITTQNLKEIITIIGGVDINLDIELKDSKYPNQDYIDNPKSGAPIYKTIYYPAGNNHLDASNITEFVRSRKSSETVAGGGTDLGRIVRQQKLFDAILQKIIQIRDPKIILSLYRYFDQKISHNFIKQDYLKLGIKLIPNFRQIKIEKISIPTGENPKTDIIYHPTSFINQQWVFITSTPDYQTLKSFISKSLLY